MTLLAHSSATDPIMVALSYCWLHSPIWISNPGAWWFGLLPCVKYLTIDQKKATQWTRLPQGGSNISNLTPSCREAISGFETVASRSQGVNFYWTGIKNEVKTCVSLQWVLAKANVKQHHLRGCSNLNSYRRTSGKIFPCISFEGLPAKYAHLCALKHPYLARP